MYKLIFQIVVRHTNFSEHEFYFAQIYSARFSRHKFCGGDFVCRNHLLIRDKNFISFGTHFGVKLRYLSFKMLTNIIFLLFFDMFSDVRPSDWTPLRLKTINCTQYPKSTFPFLCSVITFRIWMESGFFDCTQFFI